MKKYSIAILIAHLVLITGCSEKDMAYYQDNPDAAEERMQECNESLREARKNKDKEAFKNLLNDNECKAANRALKAIKIAEREAEKAAIESENQAMVATAEKALMQKHGNLDWKGFLKVYKASGCHTHYSFGGKISSEDAQCAAMKQHYESLIGNAENAFANTPYDELITKEKEYCSLDKGRLSPCTIWKRSLSKSAKNSFKDTPYETLFKEKDKYCKIKSEFKHSFCSAYNKVLNTKKTIVIKKYAQDDELFTSEYKKCYEKSLTTKSRNYLNGGQVLASDDPICHAVNHASKHRGLYNLNGFKAPLNQ